MDGKELHGCSEQIPTWKLRHYIILLYDRKKVVKYLVATS